MLLSGVGKAPVNPSEVEVAIHQKISGPVIQSARERDPSVHVDVIRKSSTPVDNRSDMPAHAVSRSTPEDDPPSI